jgi:hypothetical protein
VIGKGKKDARFPFTLDLVLTIGSQMKFRDSMCVD